MVYFVTRHVERIDEYRAFADDMIKFLRTTASSRPELKAYLDSLIQIVQQNPRAVRRAEGEHQVAGIRR